MLCARRPGDQPAARRAALGASEQRDGGAERLRPGGPALCQLRKLRLLLVQQEPGRHVHGLRPLRRSVSARGRPRLELEGRDGEHRVRAPVHRCRQERLRVEPQRRRPEVRPPRQGALGEQGEVHGPARPGPRGRLRYQRRRALCWQQRRGRAVDQHGERTDELEGARRSVCRNGLVVPLCPQRPGHHCRAEFQLQAVAGLWLQQRGHRAGRAHGQQAVVLPAGQARLQLHRVLRGRPSLHRLLRLVRHAVPRLALRRQPPVEERPCQREHDEHGRSDRGALDRPRLRDVQRWRLGRAVRGHGHGLQRGRRRAPLAAQPEHAGEQRALGGETQAGQQRALRRGRRWCERRPSEQGGGQDRALV
mmetsp:Transcript_53529/g.143418  ORF Transcript_53529/g.143418 Transcript_53529/m.143418 type:complete len:363 (-) Transcript_53529:214-1302(-)